MRRILPIILIALLASCSFVSEEKEKSEKIARPAIILENAEYTLGQSMSFYSAEERATAENLKFIQYDDEGNPSITGSADYADIDTSARTMDLSGHVSLEQHGSNMHIEAESLYFDSSSSEIEAEGDVRVNSDDGIFSGTGFKGDLREDSYSFSSIKEGVFNL